MSRIQFNLLPDVKLEYIKAKHTRNTVITISVLVSVVSLSVFLILLFTTAIVQRAQLGNAKQETVRASQRLEEVESLGQALTVHNQLGTLVGLHQNKHISSRIFTYILQVTPTNVSISKLDIDFANNTMTIAGMADNHQTVNTFIDTLKFTTFSIGDQSGLKAFPSVVESSFAITSKETTYTLSVQFDPQLFSNNLPDAEGQPQTPKLAVPSLTTTRSVIDTANPLFEQPATNVTQPSGGQ